MAFQSAETAVGNFVKTGKLDFGDLVSAMIADLAKLAARAGSLPTSCMRAARSDHPGRAVWCPPWPSPGPRACIPAVWPG